MFSGDWAYMYSNDKTLLMQIGSSNCIDIHYIKQAVLSKPKNTIVLKSSPYKFRTYFNYRKISADEKFRIQNYLEAQDDVKISRGLTRWIKYYTSNWSRRHFYFDHNDKKIELMLQLIFPDLLRITMPIIEVNN
jgi:hypothetical protein